MQLSKENKKVKKTLLYDNHIELGAKMVDFSGWVMPLNYPEGITAEHLATRKRAGLFDVSHMGRFTVSGKDCLTFFQHIFTSNAASLEVGESYILSYPIKMESSGLVEKIHSSKITYLLKLKIKKIK